MDTAAAPARDRPFREIRAVFDDRLIRVYQAYPPLIASRALSAGSLVPPFKRDRMTWIKPSFLWMMYRSGWGTKPGQERVLAFDITRAGFEWALAHSCLSDFDPSVYKSHDEWKTLVSRRPVRIQWDPERSVRLQPLAWRSLQIGLSASAVERYVTDWIVQITDVTALAHEVRDLVGSGQIAAADRMTPPEQPYPLPASVAATIGASITAQR